MLSKEYIQFFKELLRNENRLSEYVDELYKGTIYTGLELNEIFGTLKREGLLSCYFADNRAWVHSISFAGRHFFDEGNEFLLLTKEEKKPKVFISHSTLDKSYVKLLVDLLLEIGLDKDYIFCSSLPGFGVKVGEDIFEYIRSQFLEYNLHVFFIHSHNFISSPICLNEMGAAWALRNNHTSILLPGFEYSDMKGVVGSQFCAIKLDEEVEMLKDHIKQIVGEITEEFNIEDSENIYHATSIDKFIKSIFQINNYNI